MSWRYWELHSSCGSSIVLSKTMMETFFTRKISAAVTACANTWFNSKLQHFHFLLVLLFIAAIALSFLFAIVLPGEGDWRFRRKFFAKNSRSLTTCSDTRVRSDKNAPTNQGLCTTGEIQKNQAIVMVLPHNKTKKYCACGSNYDSPAIVFLRPSWDWWDSRFWKQDFEDWDSAKAAQ